MSYMKPMLYTIICLIGLISVPVAGQESAAQTTVAPRETMCHRIEKLHLDKFAWMKERQVDSLEKYLHEDILYIHSNGWIENKGEVLDNILSGKLTYRDINIQENTCREDGQTVVITGKAMFFVRLDNTDIDIPLLYTEVYTLTGDFPRLFSRHACRWVKE